MWYSPFALFISRKLRRLLGMGQLEDQVDRQSARIVASVDSLRYDIARLAYIQAKADDLAVLVERNHALLTRNLDEQRHSLAENNQLFKDFQTTAFPTHISRLIERMDSMEDRGSSELSAVAGLVQRVERSLEEAQRESGENFQNLLTSADASFGKQALVQDAILQLAKVGVDQQERLHKAALGYAKDGFDKQAMDIRTLSSEIDASGSARFDTTIQKLVEVFSILRQNLGQQDAMLQSLVHELKTSDSDNTKSIVDTIVWHSQNQSEHLHANVEAIIGALRAQPRYINGGMNGVLQLPGIGVLAVPTSEAGIFNDFFIYGLDGIEKGVRKVLTDNLPDDGVALDIGASVGLHTLALGARIRHNGHLYAFEPNPNLLSALHQTRVMNGLTESLTLVSSAVGDAPGRTKFFVAPHSPLSSLYPTDSMKDSVDVDIVSLDSYFPAGQRVDVIKIDAEGAEVAVWRGMKRIRKENKHLKIVLEFAPGHFKRAGENPENFLNDMFADGFVAQRIVEPGGELEAISATEILMAETNNLFLSRNGTQK